MGKSDETRVGGALGMLNDLLYDVFGHWVARVYTAEFGPTAGWVSDRDAPRQRPTVEAPDASYEVTRGTRSPAGVPRRRPRTA